MRRWFLMGVLRDEEDTGGGGGSDNTENDNKVDEKGKDKSEKKESDDEGDDPEEIKEALSLFRGLKDPSKSTNILKYLATEAGLLGSDGDLTKKGEKVTDDKILKTLQKHLGEYKWIAPQFAGALKEMLEDQKAEIEGRFADLSANEQKRETNNAVDSLHKEFKDFKLYYPKIIKLMDDVVCGDNTSPKSYLTKLYKLAKAEAGDTKDASNSREERIKKAAKDAPSRIASSGGKDDEHKRESKALPTRREAIMMAMKQLEEEED